MIEFCYKWAAIEDQLKKFFITTKQTMIKDAIKEWNMEWLAEKIEIR